MGEFTPGPWELIWHGNEKYPFPLSVLADNHGSWVARDGTCSSKANAHLIAAAPELYEALARVMLVDLLSPDGLVAMERAQAALAHARGEQP